MMMRGQVRRPIATFVFGGIALVGLTVALDATWTSFTFSTWLLTIGAAFALCLVAVNAISIRGLRMRRTGISAEALFLDIPVGAPLFVVAGAPLATGVTLALVTGFALAALIRRGPAGAELMRHGIARTLVGLILIPLSEVYRPFSGPSPLVNGAFFALCLTVASICFVFFVSAPLASMVNGVRLTRVWSRIVRDVRFWVTAAGSIVWALIIWTVLREGHIVTAVAMWLPVVICAILLRRLEELRVENHRLMLVRDAVAAMLGSHDPLPQINAVVGTLHGPVADETLSIIAATHPRVEDWLIASTIGPPISPAGIDLRRRALARLKYASNDEVTLKDDFYVVHAYACRSPQDGELVGALVVHRRNESLSSDEHRQFVLGAQELTPLIVDLRMIATTRNAATTDALTGLANRGAIVDRLNKMLETGGIAAGSVLLLDIDHFKRVNDNLGHAAGDEVLRRIAKIISASVREIDVAGRIGGEEFLVVMAGATRDIALTVGERLRLAVSLSGLRHADGDPITVSIGAASASVGDTPDTLLARSDLALYEAKNAGRNRLVENLAVS